jgi:hypothetical protein
MFLERKVGDLSILEFVITLVIVHLLISLLVNFFK